MKQNMWNMALCLSLCFLFSPNIFSQTVNADSLLQALMPDSSNIQQKSLLPETMSPLKKVIWGETGFMRTTQWFPLTTQQRLREVDVRRKMLVAHQVLGYATVALIGATDIAGQRVYDGELNRDVHIRLKNAMFASYCTTAFLSLMSPPALVSRRDRGFSNIKYHKAFAVIHGAGIVTNYFFGRQMVRNNRQAHRAIGYTTGMALLGAMVVMRF